MDIELIGAVGTGVTVVDLAVKCSNFYRDYKFKKALDGIKLGNEKFDDFIGDFDNFSDDEKIYWCKKFLDVLHANQDKYLPTAGWLIHEQEEHKKNRGSGTPDPIIEMALQAVLGMSRTDYECCIEILTRFALEKQDGNLKSDYSNSIARVWGSVVNPDPVLEVRLSIFHKYGIVADSPSLAVNGEHWSGGNISLVGEKIYEAHLKVGSLKTD